MRRSRCWTVCSFLTISAMSQGGWLFAQNDAPPQNLGLSQKGGSGLFAHPAATVLEQGQFALSVYYNREVGAGNPGAVPISLAFGLVQGIEAYGSFVSLTASPEQTEDRSLLGIKVNLFRRESENVQVSLDTKLQREELFYEQKAAGEATSFASRVVISSRLWYDVRGYMSGGYVWDSNNRRGRFLGGCALVFPLQQNLLLAAEVSTPDQFIGLREPMGKIGAKMFLFDHIQVAVGGQLDRRGSNTVGGFFLGIGFSSQGLGVGPDGDREGPTLLPEPPPLDSLSSVDASPHSSIRMEGVTFDHGDSDSVSQTASQQPACISSGHRGTALKRL